MRVDSSQKENTLSFRTLLRTLPPSDLFYLLHVFLLSRLILFPSYRHRRRFAPFIYRKHANPRADLILSP